MEKNTSTLDRWTGSNFNISANAVGRQTVYCKHIVSRYPVDNLKFQIVSLPAKGPHTVYGDWKLKSSKITKKCYQTSWNKQVFDLCVKIKEVCYLT